MACCDEPRLLPMADALARMRQAIVAVTETETVPLDQALDRILAGDLTATLAVPARDNSAMDGYALRCEDTIPLQMIGEALAGHPFSGTLVPGTCVRIMTGAPIPDGADAVAMQENTQRQGDTITLLQSARPGENIRRQGEDIATGARILDRGRRLGPVDLALIASQGIHRVAVLRQLRVAIFSTGDELVPPGEALAAGQLYDSNRYGIAAVLRRLNVEVRDLGLIPDQPDAIKNTLQTAGDWADAVISSGGVSVGDADFVRSALEQSGAVDFWKVAIKPGKPFAFGKLGNSRFFGLPGNPVSALITLHQLALPILREMAGESVAPQPPLQIKTASRFRKRPGRCDYQRARLSTEADGSNRVHSTGDQGSGILTSFTGANCYAVLEQERGSVEAGEWVSVLPFDRFID